MACRSVASRLPVMPQPCPLPPQDVYEDEGSPGTQHQALLTQCDCWRRPIVYASEERLGRAGDWRIWAERVFVWAAAVVMASGGQRSTAPKTAAVVFHTTQPARVA